MNEQDVLNSPFDIETHKKTFTNYLEAVISPDGVIEYAVPSHNAKLENILMKRLNISRKALNNLCPREYLCNYNKWLCKETGYIMVWGLPISFIIGKPNQKQQEALDMLKREELI